MTEPAGTWKTDAELAEERERDARKPSRKPKEVTSDG